MTAQNYPEQTQGKREEVEKEKVIRQLERKEKA